MARHITQWLMETPAFHHPALQGLWAQWETHCALGEAQWHWLASHASVLPPLRRGQRLFAPGERPDWLYIVAGGLLAGLSWDAQGSRRILRLAPPADSMMTLRNLYTRQQVEYEIVALRQSTVICIGAAAMRRYKESCQQGDVLADVLREKQLKQLRQQNALVLMPHEVERYRHFYHKMPGLRAITSQQEQADYLNISRVSITRAMRKILRGH